MAVTFCCMMSRSVKKSVQKCKIILRVLISSVIGFLPAVGDTQKIQWVCIQCGKNPRQGPQKW